MYKVLCSNGCSIEVEVVSESGVCSKAECGGVVLLVGKQVSI
jgi:hypothetical protein